MTPSDLGGFDRLLCRSRAHGPVISKSTFIAGVVLNDLAVQVSVDQVAYGRSGSQAFRPEWLQDLHEAVDILVKRTLQAN